MKISRKISLGAAALAVAATGVYIAGTTFAFGPQDRAERAQQFAQRFNLDQAEVGAYFDEMHQQRQQERQAERQAKLEEKLDEAVNNGQITAEQKQLILNKHEEEKAKREANRENWQNMSQEERQAEREAHRQEMKKWAEQNGIDVSAFMPELGQNRQGRGEGRGMRMGR